MLDFTRFVKSHRLVLITLALSCLAQPARADGLVETEVSAGTTNQGDVVSETKAAETIYNVEITENAAIIEELPPSIGSSTPEEGAVQQGLHQEITKKN